MEKVLSMHEKKRKFGIDPGTGRLHVGGFETPMPRSRIGRIVIGSGLIGCGILGFLPILGFWMVPLGLLVLSQDVGFVRRRRRRLSVWWTRRRRRKAQPPPSA
ncbi:hypothetical protein [Rhizobium sp. SSA_523]|uniref:hypothetical protein n=1 Tax=Rhizobium sp. SSA_523 TaxID=2952477 RepID=UPI0020919CB8|nr:hypothetical protein [Rhizobium sp. SSA_523]MCO5734025.1 hypothetical protein [Rhizobium sp. SSA_523]WKC25881.1 hypothetical protein QTJ18_11560 [Rhizobium sp. SSA_523]